MQSLAQITARAIGGLDEVIQKMQPAITLVQGDTTTAFWYALASRITNTLPLVVWKRVYARVLNLLRFQKK